MGRLTETEIFDRLTASFKLAAELADDLARLPLKGPTYDRFRKELRLIEGCCKQAAAWREDTRWLPIGMMMAEVHQRAGDWLRGFKMPDGSRVKIAATQINPCFTKLAENLRALERVALDTKNKATGRVGMILPEMQRGPHRDTRPAGWRAPPPATTPSGLIIPDGVSLH
jgi:hypothetical protein